MPKLVDWDNIEDEEIVKEDVPSITATEQAGQQVNPQTTATPTRPQQEPIPEGRFPNPKSGHSAVDLSKKVNRDKMWEEYNEWYTLGRKGRHNPFNPYGDSTPEEITQR